MMSLEAIEQLADEAAERAAAEKKRPYVPYDAKEVLEYGVSRAIPFPNIGSYRPKGWKLVEELFVDSSGFGAENEPALTIRGLREKIAGHISAGKEYGYALIEEGQFQVYIGVFRKTRR